MGESVLWRTFQGDAHIDFQGVGALVFDDAFYDDLQFPIAAGKVPAANAPSWEAFGALNNAEYAFGVGEYIDCQANEPSHGWKEESEAEVHIHFTTKTLQNSGASQFVKFQLWVQYADAFGVWSESSFTKEIEIKNGTPAMKHYLVDIGEFSLGAYHIGMQLKTRIKRIAATGTEYLADVFITQCGMHLQHDTLGSRQEYAK